MVKEKIIEKKYQLYERIDETKDVIIVKFKPENGQPLNFTPGMFIMISGIDETGKVREARAFSIASDPLSPILELYAVKEHPLLGVMHRTFFLDAKINSTFIVKGPYGQFVFDINNDKKVLLIAGGTGVAPFMSFLKHMDATSSNIDVVLMYSVRFPTDIIRKDEIKEFEKKLNLKTIITVTRPQPNDNWNGLTGHIDSNMIKTQCTDFLERKVYICGPLAFVKAMQDSLSSLGAKKENVKADIWG
ncbi:MAG: FAD-dependent oxidoreductase [Candidatus Marsarchaeota archaeon]|jgi:ferredoxin-NADP reductase|nr:FAD-dependent oxidoreductase [Deltaproteobacteria bacterium]MCL5434054.1 FAD-dependent oxidoreductase [Candidatus Marsarchaeota archaeon]